MARLLILGGTAREGNETQRMVKEVAAMATAAGHEANVAWVADYMTLFTVPAWGVHETVTAWKAAVTAADALIVVSPEYNRSFPGELKIVLDKALDEYERKPVGIVTVSSGVFGGVRAREDLVRLMMRLHMVPVTTSVAIPSVTTVDTFAADTDSPIYQSTQKMLKELGEYVNAFSTNR